MSFGSCYRPQDSWTTHRFGCLYWVSIFRIHIDSRFQKAPFCQALCIARKHRGMLCMGILIALQRFMKWVVYLLESCLLRAHSLRIKATGRESLLFHRIHKYPHRHFNIKWESTFELNRLKVPKKLKLKKLSWFVLFHRCFSL